jgi:hypothetical protein
MFARLAAAILRTLYHNGCTITDVMQAFRAAGFAAGNDRED